MHCFTAVTVILCAFSCGMVKTIAEDVGFLVTPEDKTVGPALNVKLPCITKGNPKLFWTGDTTQAVLTPDEGTEPNSTRPQGKYHVDSDGSLWVRNTVKQDSGRYVCVAVYPNAAIHTSALLTVIDQRLPRHPPLGVSAVRMNSQYTVVSWRPPATGGDQSPIIRYDVIMKGGNYGNPIQKNFQVPADKNYVVIRDEDTRKYHKVLVAAVNKYGMGPHSAPEDAEWIPWSSPAMYLWRSSKPNITHVNETHVTLEWTPLQTYKDMTIQSYVLEVRDSKGSFGTVRAIHIFENQATVSVNRIGWRDHSYRVKGKVNYRTFTPWTAKAELHTDK